MKKRDIRTFFTVTPVTKRSREDSHLVGNKNRPAEPVWLVRPKPDHFSAIKLSIFITLGGSRVRTAAAQSTKVSSGRSHTWSSYIPFGHKML